MNGDSPAPTPGEPASEEARRGLPPELAERTRIALEDLHGGWSPGWTRHWPDVLAVLAGVLLLAAIIRVGAAAWKPELKTEPRASMDLPAFAVLGPTHVKPDTAAKRLAGRYLRRPVKAGAPIRAEDLGPATLPPALLAGRRVLSLQLAPGGAPDSLRAGIVATLLLSPTAAAGTGIVVRGVPVLATDSGARVVLAVTPAQLDSLAPRLGSSRAFLLTQAK